MPVITRAIAPILSAASLLLLTRCILAAALLTQQNSPPALRDPCSLCLLFSIHHVPISLPVDYRVDLNKRESLQCPAALLPPVCARCIMSGITQQCQTCLTSNKRKRTVMCDTCKRFYHLTWVGLTRAQSDIIGRWLCSFCLGRPMQIQTLIIQISTSLNIYRSVAVILHH